MTRADSLAMIESEVGVLIRRVRRVLGDRARAVHEGLQPAAYLLLAHLAEVGPTRSSAIVEAFGIDKGAISRQVQHLVELGLVERSPDPDDGRATVISMTAEAGARFGEVRDHRRKLLDERLGDWTEEDLDILVKALGRYNRALDSTS